MVKVIGIVALVVVICVLKLPTIERFVMALTRPAPTELTANVLPPPQ